MCTHFRTLEQCSGSPLLLLLLLFSAWFSCCCCCFKCCCCFISHLLPLFLFDFLLYVLCLISFPLCSLCAFQLRKRSVSNCFIGLSFLFCSCFFLCARCSLAVMRLNRETFSYYTRSPPKGISKRFIGRTTPILKWWGTHILVRQCSEMYFFLKFIPSLHILSYSLCAICCCCCWCCFFFHFYF